MRLIIIPLAYNWLVRFSASVRHDYRYDAKLANNNQIIAKWLIKLTEVYRDWGFGLCFAYIRNVKGLKFNHI